MSNKPLQTDIVNVRIKLLEVMAPRALDGSAGNLIAAAKQLEAYVLGEDSGEGVKADAKVDEAPNTAPADAVIEQGRAAPAQQEAPAQADEATDKTKTSSK